ncbi:hypothetical protein B0T20DRAFT_478186 [Sordaria brevicollis]|uniref:Glycosyltransferase sdnJ n=1 Tax=Sordaria brevicollis TaxID=83679 RepID=A0AAE0PI34_SORBR|nr:hypothetical protein B0T20DRAFT_478186 [Sordaria brevicollis]
MGSLSSPKRVLLLTNSEHGQANVFLATSYALLTLPDEDVEVHFASFPAIHKSVLSTYQYAKHDKPLARPIIFHTIPGIDMVSAWLRPEIALDRVNMNQARIGLIRAIRRMRLLLRVTLPWLGPEFVEIFSAIVEIITNVRPFIVAVDPAFSPALTALRYLDQGDQHPNSFRYVILSPNTIKDFAMPFQPRAQALWKYPCIGKAYPFPVPLLYIPWNIYLILFTIIVAAFLDSNRRSIQRHLALHTGRKGQVTTLNDLSLRPGRMHVKFLVANLPEIEFPLRVIPRHIIPCGPMIRPAKPLEEADPELSSWLSQGGMTVYVNLGTHVVFDEAGQRDMAQALKILLDVANGTLRRDTDTRLRGLKILWKVPGFGKDSQEESPIYSILGPDIESGDVRIVNWFQAEPTAILQSSNLVCAVHHGGANSFLETVCAGIPQVILPPWMDCYDFARRAEFLGIGRWGNRLASAASENSGKLCDTKELADGLIDVVLPPDLLPTPTDSLETLSSKMSALAAIIQRHPSDDISATNGS